MGHVLDLLQLKGDVVYTVTPEATVYEATSRMNQHRLGALVVVARSDARRIVGVFTERDVLRRVVGQLRYPDLVSVGEVMTADVICVTPDTTVEEAATLMQERRIRHLPVCDEDGLLAGMISIGDINAWNVQRARAEIAGLNDYIYGRV
jgi:CBS domain-containing protein